MAKQIGYAVADLSDLTQHGALPAFARAGDGSRLVAIIASDRAHAQSAAQEFRAAGYALDEFRHCLQRDDVNAVYIALPNSMRCDYAVEAARAGVHVLCEKPMAVIVAECRAMIDACRRHRAPGRRRSEVRYLAMQGRKHAACPMLDECCSRRVSP